MACNRNVYLCFSFYIKYVLKLLTFKQDFGWHFGQGGKLFDHQCEPIYLALIFCESYTTFWRETCLKYCSFTIVHFTIVLDLSNIKSQLKASFFKFIFNYMYFKIFKVCKFSYHICITKFRFNYPRFIRRISRRGSRVKL